MQFSQKKSILNCFKKEYHCPSVLPSTYSPVMPSGLALPRLRVDGGSVVNRFLMQFQADLLGIPIDIPQIVEASALGAAYLGALEAGHARLEEISRNWKLARTYEPAMGEDERQTLMHKWHRAVERAKDWIEE